MRQALLPLCSAAAAAAALIEFIGVSGHAQTITDASLAPSRIHRVQP